MYYVISKKTEPRYNYTENGGLQMYNLLLMILVSTASADNNSTEEEQPRVIYKEKTEIDFEGIELEGKIFKPQEELILERQIALFNPMIQIRDSFLYEINQSVTEMK